MTISEWHERIIEERGFFMNKFENEKRCQTYEVTDFQHNFEIDRPVTVAQQWGLHIHSTHYEVIVFIRLSSVKYIILTSTSDFVNTLL